MTNYTAIAIELDGTEMIYSGFTSFTEAVNFAKAHVIKGNGLSVRLTWREGDDDEHSITYHKPERLL